MTKSNSQCASDLKKDKQFIGQIPEWEESYKQSDDLLIRYTQDDWKSAKAVYSEHDLQILGEPVMEDWEEPYMRVLADIATSQGGTIVEVGYGMGISARLIQAKPIQKHIIIEANKEVASVAREWAASCKYETVILEGLWQEVIGEIADESIEGILFDTYPLTEKELYQNHFSFFTHAFAKLKQGGCFTYYSDGNLLVF